MSPLLQEGAAREFQRMAEGPRRVGISEFARGKAWRDTLDVAGCVEVTDRTGTVGLLLTPSYAESLSAYIAELEKELEASHIRALFDLRKDYSEPLGGEALAAAALAELDAHKDKIREFLDGGK